MALIIFAPPIQTIHCLMTQMAVVAQLVRASVCGTEGRRFEPGQSPQEV